MIWDVMTLMWRHCNIHMQALRHQCRHYDFNISHSLYILTIVDAAGGRQHDSLVLVYATSFIKEIDKGTHVNETYIYNAGCNYYIW